MNTHAEKKRLEEARADKIPWKKWGPYLSERQWGTVREDYSLDGKVWEYFTHDQSRSRAYHWGEDGIGGISDNKQKLCFSLALWNGKDPILKERLFGLTNNEGNHGEDVKEYYFYIDNTPTHSYMKLLYKYPQNAFPYDDLVKVNAQRTREEKEYELIDTGIFDKNEYFDVFIEYGKGSPEDILIKISVHNRSSEASELHLLPTLWFRNTWSWLYGKPKPILKQIAGCSGMSVVEAVHAKLGSRFLYCYGEAPLLFTENETNNERLFYTPNPTRYVKDGINNRIVHGDANAVNPQQVGTKVSAHYVLNIPPGHSKEIRLRLCDIPPDDKDHSLSAFKTYFEKEFDEILDKRKKETDEFYDSITPASIENDAAAVMRQALAGMLWSKQYYYFDAGKWLHEHGADPLVSRKTNLRNEDWFHMTNKDIISMPDKWEYPWYASWDLAFHTLALSVVDIDFAKQQLELMLREYYIHPNGQIPAYEWNFSDANPPVHSWTCIFLYKLEQQEKGKGDIEFLKRCFAKLMLNFTWWVNRKDRFGKNVFEGGFLGLDNIGVFDRSSPLPTGGHLEQADATAWMAMYCNNMLEISAELAAYDSVYEDLAIKFIDHFLFIAAALNRVGGDKHTLWNEEDGFYYDLIRMPDGSAISLKVRSMVGLLSLCASTAFEDYHAFKSPRLVDHFTYRLSKMPELRNCIHEIGEKHLGVHNRSMLALLNKERLKKVISRLLDEKEFLSPFGVRSLSRVHLEQPYVFNVNGVEYRLDYLPAESNSGMFGGNSNWRGPIWFPVNVLIIRGLLQFYLYYGDDFKVECPTGSGKWLTLFEVSKEIADRLIHIFLKDKNGCRPVYGGMKKFQEDPYWKDYILFYEYFHGDTGLGLGASHQTGWTGIVARMIQLFGRMSAKQCLEEGRNLRMGFEKE